MFDDRHTAIEERPLYGSSIRGTNWLERAHLRHLTVRLRFPKAVSRDLQLLTHKRHDCFAKAIVRWNGTFRH